MAPRKTTRPRRRPARKPRRNMRRMVRRSGNVPERASCSSKITILPAGGGNWVTGQMYENHNVQLADYARPLAISRGYQFYRIKNVKITYKFPYDTYQAVAGGASRPNFYFMLDKAGAIPLGIDLNGLKAMGARPRQCDEKPISISWAPTVLTVDETVGGALPAQYKTSPWLSTDVPTVAHNGVFWFIEQLFGAGVQYQAEIEVQFEFKKPLWTAVGVAPAIGTVLATVEQEKPTVVPTA